MPTALPHLFIDYENLQPPAADFARLRGLDCRIWLFHGPHQNRFEADVVAAWQPLGERLRFVQGAKSGKNALDFHIAFALGQAWQQDAAQGTPAHYLVVSKDTGFDALIEHLHGLGARAARTKSIADALAAATPGDAAPTHASAARRAAPPKATAKASGKSAARSSGKSAGPTQPEASEADAAAASPKPAAPSPRAEAAGSPKATRAARRAPASKPGPAPAPRTRPVQPFRPAGEDGGQGGRRTHGCHPARQPAPRGQARWLDPRAEASGPGRAVEQRPLRPRRRASHPRAGAMAGG